MSFRLDHITVGNSVIRVIPGSKHECGLGQECSVTKVTETTIFIQHLPDFNSSRFFKENGQAVNGDDSFIVPISRQL